MHRLALIGRSAPASIRSGTRIGHRIGNAASTLKQQTHTKAATAAADASGRSKSWLLHGAAACIGGSIVYLHYSSDNTVSAAASDDPEAKPKNKPAAATDEKPASPPPPKRRPLFAGQLDDDNAGTGGPVPEPLDIDTSGTGASGADVPVPLVPADVVDKKGHHHADFAHVHLEAPQVENLLDSESFQLNSKGDIEWHSTSSRPRIVVLGTGWGSVSFLKGLDVGNYELVVISPRNYFLFTPLLPSACTGTLEMGSLTEPIRQILLDRHKTVQSQYVEAKAVGLDRTGRKVECMDSNGRRFFVEYDHLVIGCGANNATFNTQGVKDHAFFLKEAKHARLIRSRILSHFERAASPTTSVAEKEALLQFVVVGGGPTGVEFAGELIDFLDADLSKQFPSLIPLVRVRMLQSQEHILNTYDAAISRYAEEKFRELRIEVITNARVEGITESALTFTDKISKTQKTIPFGVCLWSTGIEMIPFVKHVTAQIAGQESDKALVTDEYLRILEEIPHLDRLPKRIANEAVMTIAPRGTPAAVAAAAAKAGASAAPSDSDVECRPACDLKVDPRVYAIGDCATTYIPKLSKRMRHVFEAADRNGDGVLSYDELRDLCRTLEDKFPVMSAQMSMILGQFSRYDARHQDVGVSLADFKEMLSEADKSVRAYPATAQVASQQGKYLARRFNAYAKQQKQQQQQSSGEHTKGLDHLQLARRAAEGGGFVEGAVDASGVYHRVTHPPVLLPQLSDRPFRYRHLGSLAYIGGESAAIDLGQAGTFTGWAAFWLWKSAYLNEAVSMRTRLNLAWDWTKTWFFGRDTSKP